MFTGLEREERPLYLAMKLLVGLFTTILWHLTTPMTRPDCSVPSSSLSASYHQSFNTSLLASIQHKII